MAHLGMLRDYEFGENVDDIRGADLFGPDNERLGEIDDVIFDHATGDIRYLVVDTGGWLSSNKFIVPANRIQPYHRASDDAGENDFYTDLTKARIEQFPAYDEKLLDKRDTWAEYERKYENAWTEGPVMHREGSPNIITPPAGEIPVDPGAKPVVRETRDLTPERVGDKFSMPRASQTSRLTSFQENIRTARNSWAEECEECRKAA